MLYPLLNGLRLKFTDSAYDGRDRVYLVDEGKLRYVDENKYHQIFNNFNDIWSVERPDKMEMGPQMYGKMAVWDGKYYLYDSDIGQVKNIRPIIGDYTIHRYNFKITDIWSMPEDPEIASYANGAKIEWLPNVNGCRVRVSGFDEVYLIDNGTKRHIADNNTYKRLFGDSELFQINTLDDIPDGHDIHSSARLVSLGSNMPVYLIDLDRETDRYIKRLVYGNAVKQMYGFDRGNVNQISIDDLVAIPEKNSFGLI